MIEKNSTNGLTVKFEVCDSPSEFTGERFVPGYKDGSIELEHIHRYFAILPLVEGRDVLDIACGEGYGSSLLAQRAESVLGVDIDSGSIERAKASYGRPNLTFADGDVYSIPSDPAKFDVIVSFETIEHVEDHHKTLSEFKRVLRPDGLLVISTPDRDFYRADGEEENQFHKKELNFKEFDILLRSFFRNVSYFKQEIVFGSLMVPAPVANSLGGNDLRIQRLNAKNNELSDQTAFSDLGEFIVAIASEYVIATSTASIYAGEYGPKPMSALLGGIRERDADISRLRVSVRQQASEIEALQQEITTRQNEITTRENEIENQRHVIENQEAELASYRMKIDAIFSSTSWRITGPLRRIVRLLRH